MSNVRCRRRGGVSRSLQAGAESWLEQLNACKPIPPKLSVVGFYMDGKRGFGKYCDSFGREGRSRHFGLKFEPIYATEQV